MNPDVYETELRYNTILEIDSSIAKRKGYDNIQSYYKDMETLTCLKTVTIPTLLLLSKDDFVIPLEATYDAIYLDKINSNITSIVTDHGGHYAFIDKDDKHWLNHKIHDWIVNQYNKNL